MEDILKILSDYGVLGILVVLVVFGWLVPKAYYDREIKRGDAATEATAQTSEALRLNAENTKVLVAEVTGLRSEVKVLREIDVGQLRDEIKNLRADLRTKSAGG